MRELNWKLAVGIGAMSALLACSAPPAPTPPEVPPVITSFKADKSSVSPGTAVKLTFTAERAKQVTLLDQSGNPVTLSGDAAAGEATVTPTQTSFYVLKVSGTGGKDTAFVQVAVSEGLRQVFLVAVPNEVRSGEPVTLVWSAIGGTAITLKDASGATLSMAESGTLEVKPTRSTSFELKATGLTGPLSAQAQVTVRPAISRFVVDPPTAKQSEKLNFAWKTQGADAVRLTEATFGELIRISSQAAVDDGTFEFTIPADFDADAGPLPDGGVSASRPVPDHFPLRFTLEATTQSPAQSTKAELPSFVRTGPSILTFEAPEFVTEGKPATVRWTVLNAHRTEVLLDGALVMSTLPPATANGSFTLPQVRADVTVTLVAYDFQGLSIRQSKQLAVARPPKVNTFTLPAAVGQGGQAVTAMWTTMNATQVVIRLKDGPVEFSTQTAAMVSAGMTALRPGRSAVYVLDAYNAAGDRDTMEKAITVTTPLVATATPNPAAPSASVTLSWDVSAQSPSDVLGIPAEPPASMSGSTGFIDIHGLPRTAKLNFSSANDAVAGFTPGFGFVFPSAGTPFTSFTASTNGFLALGTATSSLASNVDLKGTSGLPSVRMLAPFWDDLDLSTSGAVEWSLEGTGFPRRLVVQWNTVHLAADPAVELTFQLQLFETGEVRFQYKTLTGGAMAQGSTATVGIFFGTGVFAGQHSINMPTLSDGLQLTWFANGLVTGTRQVVVGSTSLTTGFFYRTAQNNHVWVPLTVRVFGAGAVVVNEVMAQGAPGVTEGQFVELYNASGLDQDLGGLELSTVSAPAQTFSIPPDTRVPNGGYVVVGQSTTLANNGGATVDVGYGAALSIGAADTVALKVLGAPLSDGGVTAPFTVSSYAWAASDAGISLQRDPAVGGGLPRCAPTQGFGAAGSLGTPKAANETCFFYTLSTIPVAFEDVSNSAPLLPTSTEWDDERATVNAPFNYFGIDAGSLVVSANGWISTRPGESATGNGNKSSPGSGTPVGVIAVFWDDLDHNPASPDSNAYSARVGNHQVVQWKSAGIFGDNTANLNFQAKLFDNGVIEFHYAQMDDGNDVGLARGRSATVWLEAPDGGSAYPVSINAPNISPQTAYRFTPKP